MDKDHQSRWARLNAQLAAGGSAPAHDPRILATITQEMNEMDQDIGQVVAALKMHNETINNHQDALKNQGERSAEVNARLLELEQKAVGSGFAAAKPASENNHRIASEIAAADGFAALKSGQKTTGRMVQAAGVRAIVTNPGRGDSDATSYPSAPQRAPGIQGIPTPQLTLLDVLPVLPVESATFEYVRLDGFMNGGGNQEKEGDEKGEADLPTELVRAEIATVAAWLPASKQVLDDNDQLQSQIGLLMGTGVRQNLERDILSGAGGPGEIDGLLNQAMPFIANKQHPADRIGEAITALRAAGWVPNVVVMNPQDWFDIASERAEGDGKDGQYVLGSPRDPSPPALWGVPVVVSLSMPAGQALVLDTRTLALLDRQELTVEASRHDGNNFKRNLVTILAELRAGLAVYATTANLQVELSSTGT